MSITGIDDDDEKWLNNIKSTMPGTRGDELVKSARNGDLWRVETLLDHGEDINYRDGRVLLAAISQKHHAIVDMLITRGITLNAELKNDALAESAAQADVPLVRKFLEMGADANNDNAAALSVAIPRGNAEVIRLLLAGGADVAARSGEFLCIAIAHGHGDAALTMLQFGADPEVYYRSMNALDWSIEIGKREVTAAIREGNTGIVMTRAYFETRDIDTLRTENPTYPGHTGFHLAAKAGHFDVIRDKFISTPGAVLQTEDLTRQTLAGQSVLLLLGKTGRAADAFDPHLWAGRRDEVMTLFHKHLPPAFQPQVDMDSVLTAIDRIALKQRARGLHLKPRAPNTP